MKKKIINLEFLKANLSLIENHLIEMEGLIIKCKNAILPTIANTKELLNMPLLEYRKIQIQNLLLYLKNIEKINNQYYKNIEKAFSQIHKLKDTDILDSFSVSVQNHIIKKIKKKYSLKLKNIKEKTYYFIFNLNKTLYCAYGKLHKILKFYNKEELQEFLKKNKNVVIFPDPNLWKIFFPKKISFFYLIIIENPIISKKYFIISYNKILCKEKIDNFKIYKIDNTNKLIKGYFYIKGKKIYYLE